MECRTLSRLSGSTRIGGKYVGYFASDNGPWLGYKEDSGSADPLRGGKFSYYEGGVRVPCILRWKGTIPAGVTSDAIIASIDLFPTIMHYVGCKSFRQEIDGVDISSFLKTLLCGCVMSMSM